MLRGSRDMGFYQTHKLKGGQGGKYCSIILGWKGAHHMTKKAGLAGL